MPKIAVKNPKMAKKCTLKSAINLRFDKKTQKFTISLFRPPGPRETLQKWPKSGFSIFKARYIYTFYQEIPKSHVKKSKIRDFR